MERNAVKKYEQNKNKEYKHILKSIIIKWVDEKEIKLI